MLGHRLASQLGLRKALSWWTCLASHWTWSSLADWLAGLTSDLLHHHTLAWHTGFWAESGPQTPGLPYLPSSGTVRQGPTTVSPWQGISGLCCFLTIRYTFQLSLKSLFIIHVSIKLLGNVYVYLVPCCRTGNEKQQQIISLGFNESEGNTAEREQRATRPFSWPTGANIVCYIFPRALHNHNISKVGRDIWRLCSPASLTQAEQVAQDHIQSSFEQLQKLSGQSVLVFNHLYSDYFFSPCFKLKLL